MDYTEMMMIYGGFFALMLLMLATMRTNMMVELRAMMFRGSKVIWFFYNNKKPKLVLPDKVDSGGVYFKNRGRHVMEFYPIKHTSWMNCGPTQVAIIFEGVSYPIDLRYMQMAVKAKKLGFPDYTQFEVACCLQRLEKDLGEKIDSNFLNRPQDLTQDGENYKHYSRGIEWIKEQVVNMTGDPWTFSATDAEVKRSLDNRNYNADDSAFSLLEDFRSWINRNASTHDIEDMQTSQRVAIQEDALFGKGILSGINPMTIVMILIAVAIAYVIVSSAGGGGIIGQLLKTSPISGPTTTLVTAIGM